MSEQQDPRYVEYRLRVPADRVDEAIARLQSYGIEYTWLDAPIETLVIADGYDYREVEAESVLLHAYEEVADDWSPYLLDKQQREMAEWMGELAQAVEVQVPDAVTEDPALEFAAIEVGPGLVIRPPWDEMRPEGENTLWIEPSAAFGTGLHPTTRHCLELIDRFVQPGDVVADLGAGSGILSILAQKKGAASVLAVDLNPSSENAIEYHMQLNKVQGIAIRIGDVFDVLQEQTAVYDLVALNIGGQVAIELAPLCTRIVKKSGLLLLSGLVDWIEQEVLDRYAQDGFRVRERRQGDEWVTLLLAREN